jgi:hypothetical protein
MSSMINEQTLSESTIPIEKKKRGRKKQNVVLDLEQPIIVETVKPPPKKRGRKPKGGKIIQQTVLTDKTNDNEPNVILHLKCSLNEITNVDNYSVKYVYNPNIESIQSFQFDNSKTDSFLIEQLNNETDNNNSTDINKCYNHTSINNDASEDNQMDILDNNVTFYNKKSMVSNNDVCEKLNTLKANLHNNNIYDKRSACFWCTYEFDNPPIFIPKHEFKNSYQVYGCFCGPECAVAHLMNEKIDTSIKFERYQLLNHIYGKIYNYTKNIKPAPNPHYLLDKYYGTLSIKEYRDLFRSDKLLIVVEKPLTHVFPELYEDNSDFILNQRTIPSNTTFKMKRKGATTNSISNSKKTNVFESLTSS